MYLWWIFLFKKQFTEMKFSCINYYFVPLIINRLTHLPWCLFSILHGFSHTTMENDFLREIDCSHIEPSPMTSIIREAIFVFVYIRLCAVEKNKFIISSIPDHRISEFTACWCSVGGLWWFCCRKNCGRARIWLIG